MIECPKHDTFQAIRHPLFDGSQRDGPGYINDIAVLVTKGEIQFGDTVQPICLTRQPIETVHGPERNVNVAGLGQFQLSVYFLPRPLSHFSNC